MKDQYRTEYINCPSCNDNNNSIWATENGYTAVKCQNCRLIFVNPRPVESMISEAVKTGVHKELDHKRTAIVRRVPGNIALYKRILASIFADIWQKNKPISWLDIGAGYGEFIEAVSKLAPSGSNIEGLEPMKPKADDAKKRGLNIREAYLHEITEKYDFVSLINVFSHIPDFNNFLKDIKNVLKPRGEIFLETGNIADLDSVDKVPTELDLPDHLVFAGEESIKKFLSNAGFSFIVIEKRHKDTILNALKNIVKKILNRKVTLALPYTSPYRTLLIRAKLK